MNRPIRNLSIRNRRPSPRTKTQRQARRAAAEKQRKHVDYSADGLPVSVDPPITVQADPLLKLLKEGNR
jgi:hypothetical protein